MQLRPKPKAKSIHKRLKMATTKLLAVTCLSLPSVQAVASEKPKFTGTVGLLYYSEQERVTAYEPAVELITHFQDEKKWSNKLVLDTLTGPSHNGAVPSRLAQTMTTASGTGNFRTEAGKLPLDPSFRDTRIAYTTNWSQPLGKDYEFSVGANYSTEYDFKSMGANTLWSRYFNRKNTKISLGTSFEQDEIHPVGKAPIPLTSMTPKQAGGTTKSKTIFDFLLGWTQVLSRKHIVQANYSVGVSDGYQNDPYKILTEVKAPSDPNAGDPTGDYIYENRPNSRMKNSLYVASKLHVFKSSVLSSSYRYFWDDWGVTSHTLGLEIQVPVTNSWSITPDIRIYRQSAADFYRYFLIEGEALPSKASADYRLGEMTAYTLGIKGTKRLSANGSEFSLHLQYYEQNGNASPGEAFGALVGLELAQPVRSAIVRAIYTFN